MPQYMPLLKEHTAVPSSIKASSSKHVPGVLPKPPRLLPSVRIELAAAAAAGAVLNTIPAVTSDKRTAVAAPTCSTTTASPKTRYAPEPDWPGTDMCQNSGCRAHDHEEGAALPISSRAHMYWGEIQSHSSCLNGTQMILLLGKTHFENKSPVSATGEHPGGRRLCTQQCDVGAGPLAPQPVPGTAADHAHAGVEYHYCCRCAVIRQQVGLLLGSVAGLVLQTLTRGLVLRDKSSHLVG